MKHKKTILLFTIIIITILIISITFLLLTFQNQSLTGNIILDEYTHTKAICNKTNYCQDYIITCKNNTAKEITPISGATIQHREDWIDPRNNSNTLC